MGPSIIQPGQRAISGTEAINMIMRQLNDFAMEINVINMRIQTIQNTLISKGLTTIPDLEQEWSKLVEESKRLAAASKLVTPDGHTIVPRPAAAPSAAETNPEPVAPAPVLENPDSTPGRLPADTEVTMSPEPTGAKVVGGQ